MRGGSGASDKDGAVVDALQRYPWLSERPRAGPEPGLSGGAELYGAAAAAGGEALPPGSSDEVRSRPPSSDARAPPWRSPPSEPLVPRLQLGALSSLAAAGSDPPVWSARPVRSSVEVSPPTYYSPRGVNSRP